MSESTGADFLGYGERCLTSLMNDRYIQYIKILGFEQLQRKIPLSCASNAFTRRRIFRVCK
jgi:hypothetical protein